MSKRRFVMDGGVIVDDGQYYVGGEPRFGRMAATDWLYQLLYSNIGRNVRITFEELPTEGTFGMTTFSLLLSLTRPYMARAWAWFLDGSEAGIIEKPEADRIIAEYQQQRALALAGDVERIHGEITTP